MPNVARGALQDAGLSKDDVDGYFCAGDAPGGPMAMADYMGLKVRHLDGTELRRLFLHHSSRPRGRSDRRRSLLGGADHARRQAAHGGAPARAHQTAEVDFEVPYGRDHPQHLRRCARMRHMHEFGTTSEQLAWIKVAASHHAQYNPHAMLREVVTVEDVLALADDRRPAAPAGLLRGHRRRRRA